MKDVATRLVVISAILAAFFTPSNKVQAAIVGFTCTQVTEITWDRGGLFIRCSNTSTRLESGVGLCATQGTTINDVKMFEATALGALVGGKGLTANCDNACGATVCFLGSLTLLK
jgi:hypothetical protein